MMKSYFVDHPLQYTGSQLRPGWPSDAFGVDGDSIIGFVGPASIIESTAGEEELVGDENILISSSMLHLIIAHHEASARETMLLHRLFLSSLLEVLGTDFYRKSNHIYYQEQQLSICKIRVGHPSSAFHMGFYVKATEQLPGIIGLEDLNISPQFFALHVMNKYVQEIRMLFSTTRTQHSWIPS